MTDEIILKILRDIQARQAADSRRLEIMQQDIRRELERLLRMVQHDGR